MMRALESLAWLLLPLGFFTGVKAARALKEGKVWPMVTHGLAGATLFVWSFFVPIFSFWWFLCIGMSCMAVEAIWTALKVRDSLRARE